MIALLTGKIVSKTPAELILDVSGVGYHVHTPFSTFEKMPEAGDEVTLQIFTHVREDALLLFGFFSKEEKEIFVKLLKVNGIGPKLALSILSGVPAGDFIEAVRNEDLVRLNSVPGIGRKTAEKIIIELKDKLKSMNVVSQHGTGSGRSSAVYDDAVSALVNLGYNKVQAEGVLGRVGVKKDASLTNIIKDALKELANR